MNDIDEAAYKRKAKFELVTFIGFTSGIAICLLFLIGSNGINQIRRKSLTEHIEKTQAIISEKSAKRETKRAIRSNFWDASTSSFNLEDFDNNIQNYWQMLVKYKEDNAWLAKFYGIFPSYKLKQFNIKSPNDLKQFIENNAYNNDDIAKQEEVKILNAELEPIITKRNSLTFYQNAEIRKMTLVCFTMLFGLLYIVRPLLLFVKGIFRELR